MPVSWASTFHILLSSDQEAVTPEQVVQEAQLNPPPPSFALGAFNSEAPIKVEYYIKKRATGHLKTIMDMSPDWAATQLQNYLVVEYGENVNTESILSSYANDNDIVFSYEVTNEDLPQLHVPSPKLTKEELIRKKQTKTIKVDIKNMETINGVLMNPIWDLSEGMGYIGMVDVGLQTSHPDLRAFDGQGNYTGGNLLDHLYQIDTAESTEGATDINVDTLEPISSAGIENCDYIDGDPNNNLTVGSFAGHGTHVAGLMVAKGNIAPGICKNCGLASAKFASVKLGACNEFGGQYYLTIGTTYTSWIEGLNHMAMIGVGTINLSSGKLQDNNFCSNFPNQLCFRNRSTRKFLE